MTIETARSVHATFVQRRHYSGVCWASSASRNHCPILRRDSIRLPCQSTQRILLSKNGHSRSDLSYTGRHVVEEDDVDDSVKSEVLTQWCPSGKMRHWKRKYPIASPKTNLFEDKRFFALFNLTNCNKVHATTTLSSGRLAAGLGECRRSHFFCLRYASMSLLRQAHFSRQSNVLSAFCALNTIAQWKLCRNAITNTGSRPTSSPSQGAGLSHLHHRRARQTRVRPQRVPRPFQSRRRHLPRPPSHHLVRW